MTVEPFFLPDRRARLVAIVLVLAAGVMAGAQLGKIAPLIPWYGDHMGLSLVAAGWLAALLGVFIALVALPAGLVIDRIGLSRSIFWGAAALVAGGVALALSAAPAALFAARLLEALGYMVLCIALPAVLNAISPQPWKGPVLAIWSGFVPLGFAVSDLLAAAMLPLAVPPVYLMTMAVLLAGFSVAALSALRGLPAAGGSKAGTGGLATTLVAPVVLLAASFGAFVVMSVSMFTFMPAFVAGEGAHYLLSAGAIALCVPAGNVLAGIVVRGRGVRFMSGMAVAGFAVGAAAAVPAFTLASPIAATVAAVALAVSGAFVASAQFAAIPFLTPRAGSVPVAIGLVAQAGGIGTVLGPPLAAAVVEASGWAGLGWFIAGAGGVGVACMLPLLWFSEAARPPSR